MERRIVLAGLLTGAAGVTLAAGAGFAQSTPPAPASAATSSDMPSMSDAVKTHIKDTMATGGVSLLISKIAQTKISHPMGKQFANFELAEQEGVADILKSRMMPGSKPLGMMMVPTDAEVESSLDPMGKEAVDKFKAMKEGEAFEKAYIMAEIDGHKKLLGIQDTYLKVADDEDETNIAKLIKGRVEEHLMILADIQKMLG